MLAIGVIVAAFASTQASTSSNDNDTNDEIFITTSRDKNAARRRRSKTIGVRSLLQLADHPVDGGGDLRVAERRVAAAGRHHAAIGALVAFHRMLVERFLALGDARRPRGLFELGRHGDAGGVAAGAQVAEDHRAVERAAVWRPSSKRPRG